MGNLLAYSGLTTKVKAMESRFISDEEFRKMAAMESVAETLEYLKHHPAYGPVFSHIEDTVLHRAAIEQLLTLSLYQDFAKLYRFSNLAQRRFLDLYFMHYEISILKKCLRSAVSGYQTQLNLSLIEDFLKRHSKMDLVRMTSCSSLAELADCLEGSPYYPLFVQWREGETQSLFDYEMQLDMLYFKTMWKLKDKFGSKEERQILTQCFGSKLDMLNIQWIYRSKKYYHLEPADLYALLIPVNYKLKADQLHQLAEAGDLNEFFVRLKDTRYSPLESSDFQDQPDLEALYEDVLNRVYLITSQKNPYSIAILNSYLYFKEAEFQKIITVIEGVRYGISSSEIISYIMKKEKEGYSGD